MAEVKSSEFNKKEYLKSLPQKHNIHTPQVFVLYETVINVRGMKCGGHFKNGH